MAKKNKDYKIGYWKNIKKYQCLHCAFDTLNLNVMKAHIDNNHRPKPEKKEEPKKEILRDRFNQPMVDSKGDYLYKTIK